LNFQITKGKQSSRIALTSCLRQVPQPLGPTIRCIPSPREPASRPHHDIRCFIFLLLTFLREEKQNLSTAQKESDAAFERYKDAKDAYAEAQASEPETSEEDVTKLKERMWELEDSARAKEQVLRGLQDFCD
jgi:flagellar motility protein MotE (MotC chaperone)